MATATQSPVTHALLKALSKIDRPGAFCTSGCVPGVLPGLEVEGLGAIALPLTATQAKALKKRCEQAPYGRGEQTLVDTSVRNVWRLTPDRFGLTNPAWKDFLEQTLIRVQAELGLEQRKLKAHLYDLLLYEKGSFFLPHQDGEKLDGMVATLVVMLPSIYEGGELLVRHEGCEQSIAFTAEERRFQVHFAAFYADCEHEVKRLRSGHRLSLVYNLTLASKGKAPPAPRSREHVESVAQSLQRWCDDPEAPLKLAVPLEHLYTSGGLAWDALKGVDAARARILSEAAQGVGWQCHLALLTYWETGAAGYADYTPRRRGRGRSYNDEEGEYVMEEVFDSELTAEDWHSPTGGRPAFGRLPVEAEEVVPEEALTRVKPEEEFEGYTGNAGMTLDRWYRHAAVTLWPDEHHFDVLCERGAAQAVPALGQMVASWRKARAAEADEIKARCVTFARTILTNWDADEYGGWRSMQDEKSADPMPLLVRLGDEGLIRTYLREVLTKDVSLDPAKATARAVVHHGWSAFRDELAAVFNATTVYSVERNVRLIEQVCLAGARRTADQGERSEARDLCRSLGQTMVAALKKVDGAKDPDDWRIPRIKRGVMLARLARALIAADADDVLAELVTHTLDSPDRYALRSAQAPALTRLGSWLTKKPGRARPPVMRWIGACREQLESLTAAEPTPPADFRRDAEIPCRCKDCTELKRFLRAPDEREHRFQMAQDRRSHLESAIKRHRCDVDCRTEKRSRPHVLVCAKNTASHEQRVKVFREDLKRLAHMRSLEASLNA